MTDYPRGVPPYPDGDQSEWREEGPRCCPHCGRATFALTAHFQLSPRCALSYTSDQLRNFRAMLPPGGGPMREEQRARANLAIDALEALLRKEVRR